MLQFAASVSRAEAELTVEQMLLGLVGIACSVLGWFARELYAAVDKLKEDLTKLEIRIGTDYVRYDRLQDALKPLKDTLDEIKASLSHKQDKP